MFWYLLTLNTGRNIVLIFQMGRAYLFWKYNVVYFLRIVSFAVILCIKINVRYNFSDFFFYLFMI